MSVVPLLVAIAIVVVMDVLGGPVADDAIDRKQAPKPIDQKSDSGKSPSDDSSM